MSTGNAVARRYTCSRANPDGAGAAFLRRASREQFRG